MRRYKRKGGSSAAPVQQLKTNVSPTQTISGSITNTYDSTKDTIRSISNYITENFIFVLIAGCLLIFYLYLFSTDPVSQEDIDALVVKIKCDSYTDPCPSGQEKAPSIPCVNNNCDEETCCRDSFDCSTWSGNCPKDQKKVGTNPCITDEFSECGPEVCCQQDCSSDNFSSTRCPTTKIYNPFNICSGGECLISECCDNKKTCRDHECPSGKIRKSDFASIICPAAEGGPKCTTQLCCNDDVAPDDDAPDDDAPDDDAPDDDAPDDEDDN